MTELDSKSKEYVEAIKASGLSIYDPIEIGHPELWIPTKNLEHILNAVIVGESLAGLPLRTRSKRVKSLVCDALGYPVPSGFKKTQPRFVGQNFDTYSQKSNNLQVWNEELDVTRRYTIIKINQADVIEKIKVVTGDTLGVLDTTGTLTQKYQARLIPSQEQSEKISDDDTEILKQIALADVGDLHKSSPISSPSVEQILSLNTLYARLSPLIGLEFADIGHDQERNRGAELHRLVCNALGYKNYQDDGQFPDVRHQLLEVKLQTSPTIDLGLVTPDSEAPLGVPNIANLQIRHCDVRYALFYATTNGEMVKLTNFYLTTGQNFFSRFPQFQGKVLNKKIQIPLPSDFFDS